MIKEDIKVEAATKRLHIPHLGVTLRTLFGAAEPASEVGTRPTWKVVYKDTVVGSIRLHTVGMKNV